MPHIKQAEMDKQSNSEMLSQEAPGQLIPAQLYITHMLLGIQLLAWEKYNAHSCD